jgi:hypothetical protein
MTFKVDDTEWKDTVRSFFLHLWGESLKDQPEDIYKEHFTITTE